MKLRKTNSDTSARSISVVHFSHSSFDIRHLLAEYAAFAAATPAPGVTFAP